MLHRIPPPLAVSAGGASVSGSGTLVFSNSNSVSFGVNGSTVTASIPAASVLSAGMSTHGNTAGNTGFVTGRLAIVGSNNITLSGSTNAGSMTLSIIGGAGAAGNTGYISAGADTASLGTVVFSNSNGVSFGVNGQTVTGSVATSLTNIRVSAGTTSNLLSAITFSNANGLSFGLDASTITASYTVPTVPAQFTGGFSTNGNTAGDTGLVTGRVVLAGGNNITLSGSTNGGSITVTISGPNTAAQSNQTIGLYGSSNTQLTSSGTVDARSLTIRAMGSLTVAVSASEFVLSAPNALTTAMASDAVTLSNIRVSAGTTSNLLSRLTFADGNGVSFGLNASTLTASVAAQSNQSAIKAFGVSNTGQTAGNTGVSTGVDWLLAGSNSITLSQSTAAGGPNTVWIQHPAWLTTAMLSNAVTLSNIRVSAGTTSNLLSALTFADGGGVSFGINASTITATVAAQSAESQSIGASNVGNTSGTSGVASGAQVRFVLAASDGLIGSQSVNGASATLSLINSWSTATTVSVVASANAVGANAGRFALEGHQHAGVISAGVSNVGNTAGNTTVRHGNFVLAGSNAVTLSHETGAAGSNTIHIQGPVSATTISAVQSANSIGTRGSRFALEDHYHEGIFSVGVSNDAGNTAGDTRVGPGRYVFRGGNNITLSQITAAGALNTVVVSAGAGGGFSAGVSTGGNTSGDTGVTGTRLVFAGGNNITLSQATDANGATVTVSAPNLGAGAFSGGVSTGGNTAGATGITGTRLVFVGTNMISLSQTTDANGGTLSINATQTNQSGGIYAVGNTTGQSSSSTFDARTLSIDGAGAVSVGWSNSTLRVSAPATSSLVGTNNISISTNGSTITVMNNWISSYENLVGFGTSTFTQSMNPGSVSIAVAFQLPMPLSASFIRFPMLLTTNSTTLSTAAATLSGSADVYTTFNAVVYSLGTGASSKSLQSVASGSVGWTMRNSISVAANGTEGSYSQFLSVGANGKQQTFSTQYSISNTNYSWVSASLTNYTGSRFLDIPFANSLSAGPYWLIFGMTTSSSSNSARVSAATNCRIGYATHQACGQWNANYGIMGSTNLTSGGLLGAGSFSTAGGGTTASLPISAISSSASNLRPYFQLLRWN